MNKTNQRTVICGHRGGRMTKWKGQIASAAPMALLATVSIAALSMGAAQARTISTAETTPQIFFADENHTITSTGSVSVTTTSAPAIFIQTDLSNVFTNDGTISVNLSGLGIPAAVGLELPARLLSGGEINNNGTIDVQLNSTTAASANGIFLNSTDGIAGNINNSGTITVRAQSNSSSGATAYGVHLSEMPFGPFPTPSAGLAGAINNSGTIDVMATSSGTASAYGLFVSPSLRTGGSINNSGTITVRAQANTTSGAGAHGIFVSEGLPSPFPSGNTLLNGSISNSGVIDVSAIAQTSATAYGIQIAPGVGADAVIENSGTITVLAQSNSSNDAEAYGIDVTDRAGNPFSSQTGGFFGTINNAGTIDVTAIGVSSASAYGINIHPSFSAGASVNNSGTINVLAETQTSYSATAYGIYISEDNFPGTSGGRLAGDINNSGTINVLATGITDANAYGVYVRSGLTFIFGNPTGVGAPIGVSPGAFDGNLSNSGTVSVTAASDSSASAHGYRVGGDFNGSFDNSGTISVSATARSSETAQAFGFSLSGDANGSITNNGSVSVQAFGYSSATAYGFDISGDLNSGFDNSGTISVTAVDQTDSAEAYGLYVGGIANSAIDNSGTITVSATASESTAYAAGIDVSSGVSALGSINNSGTINATARNLTSSSATAYGVRVFGGDLDGAFTNSGTISALAFADSIDQAYAAGFDLSGDANANIANSGTITAQGVGVTSATVYGIHIGGILNSDLSNSGTIAALAFDDSSSADAAAIYIQGDINGSINNSRTLAASAIYTTGFATASGIFTDSAINANVTNSGTITAFASGSSGLASGVNATNMTGDFANTGTITATARGGVTNAIGVNFDNFDGTITDVGTISATSEGGSAYAIFLGTGTGTLNVDTLDNVNGLIRVADHDVNLTSLAGPSATFEFEDANTAAGVFTTIEQGGAPWFVQDEGGANPIYSTFGQSSFSDQSLGTNQALGLSSFLGKLSSSVGNGTASKDILTFSSKGTGAATATHGAINYYPFLQVTRAQADYNVFAGSDSHVGTAALQAGALVELNNGGTIGGMISAIDIHSSSVITATGATSNSSEGRGFALDLAYTPDLYFATVTFGVSAGRITNDQRRNVGATAALSESDSNWVGVNAEISKSYDWTNSWSLTPSGKLSISRVDIGGYTETGTAAGLATVSSRKSTATTGEIGLKASKAFDAGVLTAGASLFATNWSGGDTSNVTLFGQTQAVSAANQDMSGAKFTLDLDNIRIGNGDLSIKTGVSLDDNGGIEKTLTARYQMSF